MDIDIERAEKITALNDKFRKVALLNVFVTNEVRDTLPDVPGLMQAVRDFDRFTEDNDPYGEHDFGSLEWHGEKVFWKMDYYDQEMKYGRDPLELDCKRVLTVMLASEY
jgi:hypothetical protein